MHPLSEPHNLTELAKSREHLKVPREVSNLRGSERAHRRPLSPLFGCVLLPGAALRPHRPPATPAEAERFSRPPTLGSFPHWGASPNSRSPQIAPCAFWLPAASSTLHAHRGWGRPSEALLAFVGSHRRMRPKRRDFGRSPAQVDLLNRSSSFSACQNGTFSLSRRRAVNFLKLPLSARRLLGYLSTLASPASKQGRRTFDESSPLARGGPPTRRRYAAPLRVRSFGIGLSRSHPVATTPNGDRHGQRESYCLPSSSRRRQHGLVPFRRPRDAQRRCPVRAKWNVPWLRLSRLLAALGSTRLTSTKGLVREGGTGPEDRWRKIARVEAPRVGIPLKADEGHRCE